MAASDTGTTTCMLCDSALDGTGSVCSVRCLAAAEREVRRNASRIRALRGRRGGEELRYGLALRNGQLMAALLNWSPPDRAAISVG